MPRLYTVKSFEASYQNEGDVINLASSQERFNVVDFGAKCDGVTDDTSKIKDAVAAAASRSGGIVLLPGLCAVSSPITLPTNVTLTGAGHGAGLAILAGFSGSNVLLLNGDFAAVRNLQIVGPTTTFSGNPAADAIQITGARRCIVDNITFYYINGWMVQVSSTSSINCYNTHIARLYGFNCKNGIHTLGSGANAQPYGMSAFINECSMDFSSGTGDCYLFEDSNDVLVQHCYGDFLGGSGTVIHIKGACNGVYVSNFDIGPYPGTFGNVVVIESSSNGSPSFCGFSNGIIEGGSIGFSMTAGQQISLTNVEFYNNNTGVNIAGGFAYVITGCFFYLNGAQAGTNYDFVSTTAGNGEIRGCHFLTPQGSSAGQTTNAVNVTTGTVVMSDCAFYGTGYNSSNIFNGKPSVIRNCPGYNPLMHSITQPAVPSSTVAQTNTFSVDATVYVVGGTVTAITVAGAATGLTSGAVRVPAGQTIAITYSVAPTWQWFGD